MMMSALNGAKIVLFGVCLVLISCRVEEPRAPAKTPLLQHFPNMPHGAAQGAQANAWFDTMETVDNGNAPTVPGCQDVFGTQNATCGQLLDRWGDFCASSTHIMERLIGPRCVNGGQPPPAYLDCREVLKHPNARCVVVPDVCPPGNFIDGNNSAKCEIEGEPIPNPTVGEPTPIETGHPETAPEPIEQKASEIP
jgi:hypothetical protein